MWEGLATCSRNHRCSETTCAHRSWRPWRLIPRADSSTTAYQTSSPFGLKTPSTSYTRSAGLSLMAAPHRQRSIQRCATGLERYWLAPSAAWQTASVVARPAVRIRMQADDPIGSRFVKAINALQEAIQTSPIAKFKKQMAVMQAGDYDKPAVSAKLESLISDNGAVMFSFTT